MSQSSSILASARKYGITGIALHMAGFVIGFTSTGLVIQGVIGIGAGTTVLAPFSDVLYVLGLVVVFVAAAKAGVPMKYLFIAGAVVAIGVFYRGQSHEIHVASGFGLGIEHPAHIGLGHILMTISTVAVAVMTFVHIRRSKGK